MGGDYSEKDFDKEIAELLATATSSTSNRMQIAEDLTRKVYDERPKPGAFYLGRVLMAKADFLEKEGDEEAYRQTICEALNIYEQGALAGDESCLMIFISLCATFAGTDVGEAEQWDKSLDAVISSMPPDKVERVMGHVRVLHPRMAEHLAANGSLRPDAGPKKDAS